MPQCLIQLLTQEKPRGFKPMAVKLYPNCRASYWVTPMCCRWPSQCPDTLFCVKSQHPRSSGLCKHRRAEETLHSQWPPSIGALAGFKMNHNTKPFTYRLGIVILTQLHLTMHSFLTFIWRRLRVRARVCVLVCVGETLSMYWLIQCGSEDPSMNICTS